MSIWDVLGIAPGADRSAIRRAYAKRLRVTNPEDDAEGFKQLRAAYEMALAYADSAAVWADDVEDTPGDRHVTGADEPAFFSFAEHPELRCPPPPMPSAPPEPESGDEDGDPVFRQFVIVPAAKAPPPDDIATLLAAREADIARLGDLLAHLERALGGPWTADDATARETFAAILALPVLGEIRVHGDVEAAIAALVAATIPRSDAILAEAVAAFGWSEDRAGRMPPPVAAVLARLDEWRLIAGLEHRGHPLHAAWRSLTRPAGPYWSWRLKALGPGIESGAATLLGEHGPISPGLAYSFKADSVARWRRLLAAPHWTFGMLRAVPLTLLLYLFLNDALGDPVAAIEPWASWAIGLGILLSPCAPFSARALRARWRPRGRNGWVGALVAVLVGAMLLPESRWGLLGLTMASALAWGWMAVAGGPASYAEVRERLRASWLTILICALFGGAAGASTLDPVHRAALALVLALGATLMVGPLTPAATLLTRLPRWRASFAVPIVLVVALLAYAASLAAVPGPGGIFYAATLTLVAGFTIVAAARIAGVHGNAEHNALRLAKMALAGVFVFAAMVSLDEASPTRPAVDAPSPPEIGHNPQAV